MDMSETIFKIFRNNGEEWTGIGVDPFQHKVVVLKKGCLTADGSIQFLFRPEIHDLAGMDILFSGDELLVPEEDDSEWSWFLSEDGKNRLISAWEECTPGNIGDVADAVEELVEELSWSLMASEKRRARKISVQEIFSLAKAVQPAAHRLEILI